MASWENIFDTDDETSTENATTHSHDGDGPAVESQEPHEIVIDWDHKEWWRFILAATESVRSTKGKQRRPLSILSVCSGIGAESAALTKLGMDHRVIASVDLKETVYMLEARKKDPCRPLHFYSDIFRVLDGTAECAFHPDAKSPCCFMKCPGLDILDLLVAGFPCQPYSQQSAKRSKPGGVVQHPKFEVTNAMFDCLRQFEPRAFVFENVPGFRDSVRGFEKTPLESFVKGLEELGYEFTVVQLYLSDWTAADRTRLP